VYRDQRATRPYVRIDLFRQRVGNVAHIGQHDGFVRRPIPLQGRFQQRRIEEPVALGKHPVPPARLGISAACVIEQEHVRHRAIVLVLALVRCVIVKHAPDGLKTTAIGMVIQPAHQVPVELAPVGEALYQAQRLLVRGYRHVPVWKVHKVHRGAGGYHLRIGAHGPLGIR